MRWNNLLRKAATARSASRFLIRPRVEELEARVVPYALTGYAWPHPELVTISFVPDGTDLGGVSSNLFAKMNARFGSAAVWQNQIVKGAQVWAQQTNINFAVVEDNGAVSGSGNYEQGDPNMGDIRIGGYAFSGSTLGVADYSPQGNNYSVGGDITFNTKQSWNIGSTYDLFTVAMHEFGHSLGLGESNTAGSAMWSSYTSALKGLSSDDITGIRKIYSAGNSRSADTYDATSNGNFSTASNLTSAIDPTSKTAVVTNLNITTTAEMDYYKFTVPAGSASTLTVTVQSDDLSLLSPTLVVYNSSQTQIGSASGAGQFGATISLTVTGVTAGSTYYFKVDGADASAFGTGSYAVVLNMGNGPTPVAAPANTTTPNGNPLHDSGGGAEHTQVGLIGGVLDWLLGGLLGGLLHGIFAGWGDAQELPGHEGDAGRPTHAGPAGTGALTRDAAPAFNEMPLSLPFFQVAGRSPESTVALVVSPAQAALVPTPALGLPAVWVDAGSLSGTADPRDDELATVDPLWSEVPECSVSGTAPATEAAPTSREESPDSVLPSPSTVVAPAMEATCVAAPEWMQSNQQDQTEDIDPVAAASAWQAVEACFAELADLFTGV